LQLLLDPHSLCPDRVQLLIHVILHDTIVTSSTTIVKVPLTLNASVGVAERCYGSHHVLPDAAMNGQLKPLP